ncbi:MAG: InlB B-repeat-containing protein [Clostridia bacterium]|nr:InlB B-repeat-containing protein [Clostridia bacterium]
MQKRREKTAFKAIGLICVIALLFGALYVPMSFGVNAAEALPVVENETTVFGFEDSIPTSAGAENKAEFEANGVGYFGWGATIGNAADDSSNKVYTAYRAGKEGWFTFGTYRLNKLEDGKYKVYNLEPATTYLVTMKVRVTAAPVFTDDSKTEYECYMSLGYGAKKTGTDTNYSNGLEKKLVEKFVSTKAGSGAYTLKSDAGNKSLSCGNDWQEVVYKFTTPAELGNVDRALAVYAHTRGGFCADIDDIAVTKLSADTGVVILNDEYSSKSDVKMGKIGSELSLPDISDRAQQADHRFDGWYKDAARTEKIDKLAFTKDLQLAYTAWKAPVTITFVDKLNGTEKVISGVAGDSFDYPADPVDPSDKSWFMGWYTGEAYTEEHTSGKFGYASINLYAYFKGEVPGLTQDFEEYPYGKKEVHTVTDAATGVAHKRYKDYLAFCNTMTLQGDVTASADSKKAVKFVWDSTKEKDLVKGIGTDDPDAYNAATRYYEHDNVIWLGKGIEDNQAYNVTFKVKVEKAETDLEFYLLSAAQSNCWANYVRYQPGYNTYKVSDEWQTVTFRFNTKFKNETAIYMYLGVRMKENKDVVLYIDDLEIEAVTQPYESILFVNNGYNDEVISIIGKCGEPLDLPALTHPGEAPFEGWFTDVACTEKLTVTTYQRKNLTVYAKWGIATIKFRNDYPFNTTNTNSFGRLFTIVNEKGIGKDDDYAIRWSFVGKEPYKEGVLWATRGSQFDSVFPVAKNLKDGALYRITYDYMATSKTNVKVSITPASCGEQNIWWNNVRYVYNNAAVTVPEGGCGWQSAEVYISANVLKTDSLTGDALFLLFRTANNDEKNVADVRIDNIRVEEVTAPYVFFDSQNGDDVYLRRGEEGDKIEYPANPKRFGHTFKGWYTDRECTEKFTLDTFTADTAVTAYAGWSAASEITYSFEKYDVFNGYAGKSYFISDAKVDGKKARTGSKAVHFDNRTEGNYNRGGSYVAVAQGVDSCKLELGYMYVVNLYLYVNSAETGNLNLRFVGAPEGHYWAGKNNMCFLNDESSITAGSVKVNKGKWINKTFVLDTSVLIEKDKKDYLYLFLQVMGAENWDFCVDDITVTKIPKGQTAVCIDNQGCKSVPSVLIGRPGASFASKLPEKPEYNDMYFKGYYTKDEQGAYNELKREDMKFKKEAFTLYARFLDYEVTENFDGDYLEKGKDYVQSYTTYDFDYEIYDATKEGNSKDNVVSGNNSLHRKGDSMYFENAVILTLGNQIAEGERYTVSFKVKLGDYKQTDGAIKVVSGRSFRYAWTTTGDYYPVVAIKDLLDGQWHEVSYTFNSVEAFACVQTPGYVELFMDDFKFTIAGDEAPLSTPVPFTEYVPAKRDAEGNLINKADSAIDVTSIIDISLYQNNNTLIIVIAAVAAVIIIAGVILAFVLVKKKKQAKA